MKRLFLSYFILFLGIYAFSQQRVYRQFATQKVHQRFLEENPKLNAEQLKIERQLSKDKTLRTHSVEAYIPLFFHVIFNKEEERISYEQIIGQIESLNEDFKFSLLPEQLEMQRPFKGQKNNKTETYRIDLHEQERLLLDIQFCLAKDEGNTSEQGINFISTEVNKWGIDDAIKFTTKDGSDVVKPNQYLNIWIGHLEEDANGYAQLPGGIKQTDGIVIDYRFFGVNENDPSPYNLGKTLTHLIGNYLGLYDLWNESNPCADDKISDTPIHSSPNYGCPEYRHINNCIGITTEMTMNFMDNTDDACMNMFTVGQVTRMHKMLAPSGPRHGILNKDNFCSASLDPLQEKPILSRLSNKSNLASSTKIEVYPNPASEFIQVVIKNSRFAIGEIYVYNTLGELVDSQTFEVENKQTDLMIDTHSWNAGIYFIHLQIDDFKMAKQISILPH